MFDSHNLCHCLDGRQRIFTMGHLSERAMQKISGRAWQPLRNAFLEINRQLLDVAPDAYGDLTTVYIKYTLDKRTYTGVFAVVWVKTSKQLVVGLALPETYQSDHLGEAPARMKYKDLTKYFSICPGESVPAEFGDWARAAYESVKLKNREDSS